MRQLPEKLAERFFSKIDNPIVRLKPWYDKIDVCTASKTSVSIFFRRIDGFRFSVYLNGEFDEAKGMVSNFKFALIVNENSTNENRYYNDVFDLISEKSHKDLLSTESYEADRFYPGWHDMASSKPYLLSQFKQIAIDITKAFDTVHPIPEPKLEVGQIWLFYTGILNCSGVKIYRTVAITGSSYRLDKGYDKLQYDWNSDIISCFLNQSDYLLWINRDKSETYLIKNDYGYLWSASENAK